MTTKVGLMPAKPEIPFTTRSKSISKNSWKRSLPKKNFSSPLNSDFCKLFFTFLSEKSTLFGPNFLQISDNFFLFEFAETPTT